MRIVIINESDCRLCEEVGGGGNTVTPSARMRNTYSSHAMLPMHELGVDTLMSISDEVLCDEVARMQQPALESSTSCPGILYTPVYLSINTTLSSVDTGVSIPDTNMSHPK